MQDPIEQLHNEIQQIHSLLQQEKFFTLSSEERKSLVDKARELLEKLHSFTDTSLTVGLLGGTGVGKSTVMNALAGKQISSTSHRRPHTDKVLVYRHEAVSPPSVLHGRETGAPRREIVHGADAVKQVVLCDLPDFDSLVGENRRHVIDFLEHLDILVWVASPEKYADARFYDFLQAVPKARQNFYFALNKADLLIQEDPSREEGHPQLNKVSDQFKHYIAQTGIADPAVYVFSARQAYELDELPDWNQFPAFRREVFHQRDAKEIRAIKAANLDREAEQLIEVLQQEGSRLGTLQGVVQETISKVEESRSEWLRDGKSLWRDQVADRLHRHVLALLDQPAALVGPGHAVCLGLHEWSRWRRRPAQPMEDVPARILPPEEVSSMLNQRLERIENQMANRLLRRGLPSRFIQQVDQALSWQEEQEAFSERWRKFLQMQSLTVEKPAFLVFRLAQYLVYGLVLVCFVAAVAGDLAVRSFLNDPGFFPFLELVFSALIKLFSPWGLAGLGSYALINLFLGLRFYNRYKKLLRRRSRRFIETLELEFQRLWEEELEAVLFRLESLKQELDEQIATLANLETAKGR